MEELVDVEIFHRKGNQLLFTDEGKE